MLYDNTGKGYVDGMASLWYSNIGYGRADVADVVADQLKTVVHHTFPPYTNQPAEDLAAKLADLSPMPGSRIFFTSSGSEAVDTALKIARIAHKLAGNPERTILVSRGRGYHGTNYGGTSVQGIKPNQELFDPLVGDTIQIDPDSFGALEAVFAEHGDRIAAFITEPVQGAYGVYPPPPGYLTKVRELCDRYGAYMILDEVICAFGRLGTWFAAEYFDVQPDLITFAKAVTSGYVPLGGVFVSQKVREPLESDPSFILRTGYTYSAHPAACAAGLKCLEITEKEGLMEQAVRIGDQLEAGFKALAAEDLIAEERGEVAVRAVRLHPDQDAVAVRDKMLEGGAIARPVPENALAYCPPLVTTESQVDHLVETLTNAIK